MVPEKPDAWHHNDTMCQIKIFNGRIIFFHVSQSEIEVRGINTEMRERSIVLHFVFRVLKSIVCSKDFPITMSIAV